MTRYKANPFQRGVGLGLAMWIGLLFPQLAHAAYDSYDDESYGEDGSYSYLRVLDGSATVTTDGSSRQAAEINQPLLEGDRLYLDRDSRAEVVLADGNLVRIERDTEVLFDALANSPDQRSDTTQLRLLSGTLQIVVSDDAYGEELPRIDTANATVYIQQAGSYVIQAEPDDWTRVIARDGNAEVLTQRGSVVLREDEQVLVEGTGSARARVEAARESTGIEAWANRLDSDARQARYDRYDDLDEPLRYQASSLSRYGGWVEVDNRRAWRPSVDRDWEPYTRGRWSSTPSGLLWVSSEPWGWVPYHYGTWDYVSSYGWVWYPGRVWAPAWVYWYWSPSYVGWCPTGYYTHHYYRDYHQGFRGGAYGWAGGDLNVFARWNFLPVDRLRGRDQARFVRPSNQLGRDIGGNRLGRGLITTDTRGINRQVLEKPAEAVRVLANRPGRGLRGDDLPDVTPFVGREKLPPQVERQVVEVKPAEARRPQVTPLRPTYTVEPQKPALAEKPAPGSVRQGSVRPSGGEEGKAEEGRPRTVVPRPGTERPAQLQTKPGDWREKPRGGQQGAPEVKTVEPNSGRTPVMTPARPANEKPEGWREAKPADSGDNGSGRARIERRPAPAPPSNNQGGVKAEAPRPVPPRAEVKPRENGEQGSSGGGTARIQQGSGGNSSGSAGGSGRELRTKPAYQPPADSGNGGSGSGRGAVARSPQTPRPPVVVTSPAPHEAKPANQGQASSRQGQRNQGQGANGKKARVRPPAEEKKEGDGG